jgi:molybdenum cofactor guanylyltransferase
MRRLGAILAGGRSTRFGSDKASFLVGGMALLDHVAVAMRPHVEQIAVIGRQWPGLVAINDHPAPDLGPLGGLCGALVHAAENGFDGVLLAGCDTLPLPFEVILGQAEAIVIEDQPLIGWWPASSAKALADWLAFPENRAVYRWLDAFAPARVLSTLPVYNLNSPDDVRRWAESRNMKS